MRSSPLPPPCPAMHSQPTWDPCWFAGSAERSGRFRHSWWYRSIFLCRCLLGRSSLLSTHLKMLNIVREKARSFFAKSWWWFLLLLAKMRSQIGGRSRFVCRFQNCSNTGKSIDFVVPHTITTLLHDLDFICFSVWHSSEKPELSRNANYCRQRNVDHPIGQRRFLSCNMDHYMIGKEKAKH